MSFPNIPQKDPGLPTLLLDLAFLMVRHSVHVVGAILPEFSILVNSPRKLRRQNYKFAGLHRQLHVYARLHRESICVLDCTENSMLYLIENPIGVLDCIEKRVLSVSWMGGVVLYKTVIFQRYLRI